MKPSLQFRLSQHLTLTPQLQQSIRLLQLSTVELNQEIDRLLMENPALEREDGDDGGGGGGEAAAPVPVTRTVCSNCAVREPSAVTAVQPSSQMTGSMLPIVIMGSMVNVIPGSMTVFAPRS